MRGEKLERAGVEHKLIYYDSSGKHDSITIRGSKWFDHKNQTGGGAIKFMQEFYGMDFQTAVQELLGQRVTPLSHSPPKADKQEQKTRDFKLPEANSNMHRVYAYLIKQRFISAEIITHFAKQHTLYEDKTHHNAVFVGLNERVCLNRHISGQQTALAVPSVSLAAALIPVTALHISAKMNAFMSLKLLLIC